MAGYEFLMNELANLEELRAELEEFSPNEKERLNILDKMIEQTKKDAALSDAVICT